MDLEVLTCTDVGQVSRGGCNFRDGGNGSKVFREMRTKRRKCVGAVPGSKIVCQ